MAKSQIPRVLEHLRQSAGHGEDLTDGQLLECFLAERADIAFEALIRRHGPMVLGVCRRVVGHTQDAVDAFQATFLVLARKASAVWPRQKVGNWLYGVSYRIALKARAASLKRQAKEIPSSASPEPQAMPPEPGPDWLPALDREVYGLPAKYRVPIVLCDLQGKTHRDAARQLGWREGVLPGRLTRARVLLGQRLARRGFTVSLATLTTALSTQGASAEVPAALVDSTVKAAGFSALTQAVNAGVISANVAAWTEGVLQSMMWSNLKAGLVVILALAVVATGLANAFFSASGQTDPAKPAVKINNPADQSAARKEALPPDEKAAQTAERANEERRKRKQQALAPLLRALDSGAVEVFLDGDMQKPFIKGAKLVGDLDLNGRTFLIFGKGEETQIIDVARIVAFRVSR